MGIFAKINVALATPSADYIQVVLDSILFLKLAGRTIFDALRDSLLRRSFLRSRVALFSTLVRCRDIILFLDTKSSSNTNLKAIISALIRTIVPKFPLPFPLGRVLCNCAYTYLRNHRQLRLPLVSPLPQALHISARDFPDVPSAHTRPTLSILTASFEFSHPTPPIRTPVATSRVPCSSSTSGTSLYQ